MKKSKHSYKRKRAIRKRRRFDLSKDCQSASYPKRPMSRKNKLLRPIHRA